MPNHRVFFVPLILLIVSCSSTRAPNTFLRTYTYVETRSFSHRLFVYSDSPTVLQADELVPGTWYEIRVVAQSPAGETTALYRAATLARDGGEFVVAAPSFVGPYLELTAVPCGHRVTGRGSAAAGGRRSGRRSGECGEWGRHVVGRCGGGRARGGSNGHGAAGGATAGAAAAPRGAWGARGAGGAGGALRRA